ncbi:hypothetical protein, partial [Verminephrobacter aporrectodeae]|uniref:hypothetical protein n=1 Tax=Verminephrobacter aporrectodeae TaxID=1110389 RepID=UPI0022433647
SAVGKAFNTEAASREAASLLIDIKRSIGCSLKIHRVEIRVAGEDREAVRGGSGMAGDEKF